MTLTGKAFVTGSSSGLGFSIARKFYSHRADVIIHGRSTIQLERASKSLDNVPFVHGDLSHIMNVFAVLISP